MRLIAVGLLGAYNFKRENITKRSIKLLKDNIKVILKNTTKIWFASKEKKKDFNNIEKGISNIIDQSNKIIFFLLFTPLLLAGFTLHIEKGGIIIYIMVITVITLIELLVCTQELSKAINFYANSIMVPIENRPELLIINDEGIDVESKRKIYKKIFVLFILLIVFMWGTYYLKRFNWFKVLAFIFFVCEIIKEKLPFGKKKISNNPKGIKIAGDILEVLYVDIKQICDKLKINFLEIEQTNDNSIEVQTIMKENEVPKIKVSNGFINLIYNNDAKNILMFSLSHELSHIFYNDFRNVNKRMKCINIAFFGVVILIYLYFMYIPCFYLKEVIGIIFLQFNIVAWLIMGNLRYWQQIAEFRADRLAAQVWIEGKESVIAFWREYEKKNTEKKTNFLSGFYKKYIEKEAHPSMEKRMRLLETRDKWYWWEYFEHMLIILGQLVTYKGWRER